MAMLFLLMSGGGMPARTGSIWTGVGFIAPEMVRRASFSATSSFLVWRLWHQAGEAYSALEKTRARVDVRRVLKSAPQSVPASFLIRLTRERVLAVTFCRCWLKVKLLSRVTPRYTGWSSCFRGLPFRAGESVVPAFFVSQVEYGAYCLWFVLVHTQFQVPLAVVSRNFF